MTIAVFHRLQHEVVPEMSPTQMHDLRLPSGGCCSYSALSLFCLIGGLTAHGWYFRSRFMQLESVAAVSHWLDSELPRRRAFLLALSAPMYTLETWMAASFRSSDFSR